MIQQEAYHILIAEDEYVSRRTIEENLRALLPDAVFHIASDGTEAVACAERQTVHLAMMDIKMPGMDGITAAREIKRLQGACQIIFLTAYSDFGLLQQAMELGAAEYILKPFTKTAVALAVQKALDRKREKNTAELPGTAGTTEPRSFFQQDAGQILCSIADGSLNEGQTEAYLRQMGFSFRSGMFAVLCAERPKESVRIMNMIRGGIPGGTVGLLLHGDTERVLLFAVSTGSVDMEWFRMQLKRQVEKIGKILGHEIPWGMGPVIERLSDCRTACFAAFCKMRMYGQKNAEISKEISEKIIDLPLEEYCAWMSVHPAESGWDADETVNSLYEYCVWMKYNLRVIRDMFCRFFDAVLQNPECLQEIPERTQVHRMLMGCDSAEALLEMCRSPLQVILQGKKERELTDSEQQLKVKIQAFIEAHYCEDINLEQLASVTKYSKTYCSKLFPRLFGKGFLEYVTELRIEEAKKLLGCRGLSVKEIGKRVGISDAAYFTNMFRKYTGMTPSEYREHL